MSDVREFQGTPLTRRELLIARQAIRDVVGYLDSRGYFEPETAVRGSEDPRGEIDRHVLCHYPLPKVTRPRVARDSYTGREWRFIDGQIQTRDRGEWHCLANGDRHATTHPDGMHWTPERIQILSDLIANPTEEVEDGA